MISLIYAAKLALAASFLPSQSFSFHLNFVGPGATQGGMTTPHSTALKASPLVGSDVDRSHMKRAVELASKALGETRPNPAVGCVIVSPEGDVVGEGYHKKAGGPHAEVHALQDAQGKARGCTAYVTLEPCNHYGRTPPCALALVEAGVSRVVVGMRDPHKEASGGVDRLKGAGIEVECGVEGDACSRLAAPFAHHVRSGRPYGVLGGALASSSTGRKGRHTLHPACDAVVAEGLEMLQPVNGLEISDGVLRVLLTDEWGPEKKGMEGGVVFFTGTGLCAATDKAGCEVVEVDASGALEAVLQYLKEWGALTVQWEVSQATAEKLRAMDYVQEILGD